jgi:integrator complex subunit 2
MVGAAAAASANNALCQVTNDGEREELRAALVATQESAAVQILLEICLGTPRGEQEDVASSSGSRRRGEKESAASQLTDLREVRALICSYLHEAFIADPFLAKLVHFQVSLRPCHT